MMDLKIELLCEHDARDLFEFEYQNRTFFERMVPSRGDEYYNFEHFSHVLSELLQEQAEGISYFFLIREENDTMVGRINLVDTEVNGLIRMGHLGYRIGEEYSGRGLATKAVNVLLKRLPNEYGIHEVHAKTTEDNLGSQKVLEKNHFALVSVDDDKNAKEAFKHYVWKYERM
ncbi:GNAT family N-acetyltransferase [Neobacillus drentensis]|uniref:GNAT family N-acetyltransferase n=1 Tax=Neobacillus drentensis TaxID=220684 RepID=UPI003000173A